ncbi:restriction endonuclease subunit S [Microcystis flos-aquae FACHB-1344]|uniref:Restriction endonuclease subunit S n=1 Tax=Microcystis flos-aquae FACHB-1344 TaxID=2692899 RepID=A0ABR8HU76_9CHRO|nr:MULTISPECIES: restriction endonuclease subunit S [Microcystis]MBD2623050.1 restriction endonuclease subunit S [Microcystis flos-aquae FACHB-1344]MCA2699586.1 restriction endonuclease subunit S [Microcystis sp. M179S2]
MSQENDRQLPDGWQWVKLGDVCRDVSDGSHFTPTYIEEGIPFLSVKNIRETGINFDDCKFICEEEHKKLCKRCKPEKGDVLYTKVGTTGIAKAIDINREFSIFVSVALLKLKSEVIPEYLEKVLNAPICKKQAESLTQGAANRNLVIKDLKCIEIPLPPLSEQKRIAAILNEQMEAVEKARKATEAQLEAAKALPAAYLRAVFESEEANSWERRKLGEICQSNGQYGTSEKSTNVNQGLPVLRMGNIIEGKINWSDLMYVNLPTDEETKFLLKKGDVLFNRTNSAELVGKTAVFDAEFKAVFASYLIRFKMRYNLADPYYISAYINSRQGRKFIEANMTRAIGQVNISASTMYNMPIPIPPTLEKQKQIASTLTEQMQEVERLKQNLKEQLDTINKLPAVLLRRAFKGEL